MKKLLLHRNAEVNRAGVINAADRAERGVVLVITLILLSVITFMAITMLVLTHSEKGAVTTQYDQTVATLAADSATDQAKIRMLAASIAFTNPFNIDLMVSTNYINLLGFFANNSNPTNVNYEFTSAKTPLTSVQVLQNLENLIYDPRPPVWMTNRLAPPFGSNEFRFYYDVNRNGRFDATGPLPVIVNGVPVLTTNNLALSNYFVGDPQWVGILERPGFPHSPTNRFVSRYAFLVVPISKTLDLNYIHNYAKYVNPAMAPGSDSFFRNMGVGTWEINLAAFLVDLNTNLWPPATSYQYDTNYPPVANRGLAFEDALSLLRYRYGANRASIASVQSLFGLRGITAFRLDNIDGYTHGPLMLNTAWNPDYDANLITKFGWPGADNPNHFFTIQDTFDRLKTAMNIPAGVSNFSDRLISTTLSSNTYDQTTFSRLIAQLSTESAPEPPRMNVNYMNVDPIGNVLPYASTNFIPWTNAAQFFTNAAIRLLANAGYSVGPMVGANTFNPTNLLVTDGRSTNLNIQIWPTNYYTASVHRLLQLAANIYDATTNRTFGQATATNGFPSVFRPVFRSVPSKGGRQGVLLITGFQEVTDAAAMLSVPMREQTNSVAPLDMVYGVPLVVGARKGFPNFNEFAMDTSVAVTRKLQFRVTKENLADRSKATFATNQMFVVTVSNVFGVEGWNSYTNPYPRNLRMIVASDMKALITNEFNKVINFPPLATNFPVVTNFAAGNWRGGSFRLPIPATSFNFLPSSTYNAKTGLFEPINGRFDDTTFSVPHWWLNLSARLRFILLDTDANRIVDYVNLASADDPTDITDTLMREGQCPGPGEAYNPPNPATEGSMWCTNRTTATGPTFGVRNQIRACFGSSPPQGLAVSPDWTASAADLPPGLDKDAAIDFFRTNLMNYPALKTTSRIYLTNVFYAPYTATRTIHVLTSWQANDPLVHYTTGDLNNPNLLNPTNRVTFDTAFSTVPNLGFINSRYEPWPGAKSPKAPKPDPKTTSNLSLKDPLVSQSDDWDFPTNKFRNIGDLGRVHRGTPWQTVYLKSPLVDLQIWTNWTGNGKTVVNWGQFDTNIFPLPLTLRLPATNWTYDAWLTHPTNDWAIVDLFSTAFNDNAARGRLSINQSNIAAWSAVLSGVVALQADSKGNAVVHGTNFSPWVIQPVGTSGNASPLQRLVNAINDVRRTNYAGSFRKLGDILSVPELTTNSPFLNITNANQYTYGMNDAACERLPQQILGLLTLDKSPRFLIYSWGQALRPANRSIITSGPFLNLCTNYQVTAESSTRTLVRIDGLDSKPPNPHVVIEKFNVMPPD